MQEWVNWSGSLKFTPTDFLKPRNEEELKEIIRRAYIKGKKIRLAAAGHSSSPLVETSQLLVHLHHLKGVVSRDSESATLRSGMTVHESNSELQKLDLALFNTGDVDVQTLAGAISTGTHGSGRTLQNLSSMLQGVRLIDYKGDVRSFTQQNDPEIMRALRVSLGALGIFTEITVEVLPLYKLHRIELCTDVDVCLNHFDQLADENRNLDFYWYPRSDETKIRILNLPGNGTKTFVFKYNSRKEEVGLAGEILPRTRELKFDEMEYALPRETAIPCFQEMRRRILTKHRKEVAWRVLVRSIAADENYISPHYGRESISISLHHNAGLPFDEFFRDIEPIFIHHGGRPHWAKIHYMKGAQLQNLYPEWSKFQEVRKSMDPDGFFMNDHLNKIFNGDESIR